MLFMITADLESPEGTKIHVIETAYKTTSVSAEAQNAWTSAQCDSSSYDTDPTAVVRVDARAEVTGGSTPDPEYLLALDAGTSAAPFPTGFTGDWRVGQAYCSDGYLSMPGTTMGWTGFDTANGWTAGRWGVQSDTGAGDATRTMKATRCTLDRGPASAGLALPAGWDTADTQFGCFFGASL